MITSFSSRENKKENSFSKILSRGFKNKKGIVAAWYLWGIAALGGAIGWIISLLKPAEPTPAFTVPIWGWLIIGLILLIIILKK